MRRSSEASTRLGCLTRFSAQRQKRQNDLAPRSDLAPIAGNQTHFDQRIQITLHFLRSFPRVSVRQPRREFRDSSHFDPVTTIPKVQRQMPLPCICRAVPVLEALMHEVPPDDIPLPSGPARTPHPNITDGVTVVGIVDDAARAVRAGQVLRGSSATPVAGGHKCSRNRVRGRGTALTSFLPRAKHPA